MRSIKYEIENYAEPGDKVVLRWLYRQYGEDRAVWEFLANQELRRHVNVLDGYAQTVRVWSPTIEGEALWRALS